MVNVIENGYNYNDGDQKSLKCSQNGNYGKNSSDCRNGDSDGLDNTNKCTVQHSNNISKEITSVNNSGNSQIMHKYEPIKQVNSVYLYNVAKPGFNYIHGDQSSPNFSPVRNVSYGYIPKGVLLPFHNSNNNSDISVALDNTSHLDLYYKLKNSVLPNVLGARQRIKTGLAVDQWSHLLSNYWDIQLLDFIKYGFPMEVNPLNFTPNQGVHNHPSANEFPNDVCKYLKTEIEHGAILGPFRTPPPLRGYIAHP